jgi:hypothetical protein
MRLWKRRDPLRHRCQPRHWYTIDHAETSYVEKCRACGRERVRIYFR